MLSEPSTAGNRLAGTSTGPSAVGAVVVVGTVVVTGAVVVVGATVTGTQSAHLVSQALGVYPIFYD